MPYRRTGRSGLLLPAVSLGLWHNFGTDRSLDRQRAIVHKAFDLGVTHFDLANNYGPPPGAAETAFGRIFQEDLRAHRDEIIVSTKAGYLMWPGPYGEWGSRKYVLSSLDQSLKRMGLEYVDIFYSHRPDPDTPLEETMGALASAVQQGKALYAGISNYSPEQTREAARILRELGTPLLVHQPRYSMLDRAPEDGLWSELGEAGAGAVVYSPLAQGLLTNRYLDGIPADSRAASLSPFLDAGRITDETVAQLTALNDVARERGQSLAQMALAWVLREGTVTSAIAGASSPEQLADSVAATENLEFSAEELQRIDKLLAG
ncbi:aldo/keto reductase [Streptomyces sp. TRM66268-LWL]|uniref:Aldo/keto reductase n=2 Tax=Streptomyces polyasparticus TaxID=2767826 RepID=A0ABR7SF24_9ACTN|nr:aldo/keto reductase [Streptomyces polyasparticus]